MCDDKQASYSASQVVMTSTSDNAQNQSTQGSLKEDGIRFLIAGLLNTLMTFFIYQLFLFVTSPILSYTAAWLAGLIFVVVFYPTKVFSGGENTFKHRAFFAASYILIFLIGVLCLNLMIAHGLHSRLSIIIVMGITTVINFFMGRFINYYYARLRTP